MNAKYTEALPLLRQQIAFQVEEINALDLFYNDGDHRISKSFFKLVLAKALVYIYENGWWVSYGSLSDKESLAILEWIDDLGKA